MLANVIISVCSVVKVKYLGRLLITQTNMIELNISSTKPLCPPCFLEKSYSKEVNVRIY